jgi:hypothetical protein
MWRSPAESGDGQLLPDDLFPAPHCSFPEGDVGAGRGEIDRPQAVRRVAALMVTEMRALAMVTSGPARVIGRGPTVVPSAPVIRS